MTGYESYNDQELTELLRLGDRTAFGEIYARHIAYLYRFAFHIIRDEEECTDAIQDVFTWFWENREKLHITNLKAYLTAAVKYKLTRVIVASKRKEAIFCREIPVEVMSQSDDLAVKELRTVINDFVQTLPPRAKEIYLLSREQFFSNKEIAARLGISEKTVENQMTITLRKLRVYLGKLSFWSIFL